MHRGQDDGHPVLLHRRLHAHGSHDLPTQPRSAGGEGEGGAGGQEGEQENQDIRYVTGESKDVVSTSNKLKNNKEEINENDEDMFDRVSD